MPKKSAKAKLKIEKPAASSAQTYLDKISHEVQQSQSKLSMVLGGLIILVAAILLFNYANKSKASLGPAQNTQQSATEQTSADVTKDALPGQYTVKTGDTLFLIAQSYYDDGFKYNEIAKTNNITNPDSIEVGQVLDIPKIDNSITMPTTTDDIQPAATTAPVAITTTSDTVNTTAWGPAITGNQYTVTTGDWLSTISARAYGDVYSFDKIAKANNIANPNLIEPGTVLIIPR